MRLLLDTHVWLWCLREPERLGGHVSGVLADGANELWLSPISVWEALLLAGRGRIELHSEPAVWLQTVLAVLPVRDALLSREVAQLGRSMDLPQQDPADRFIAATAAVYELTLVTADALLLRGTGYPVLAAA